MLDNLRGMAVFANVVKHGSFSAAARNLGITTSAVSQQIRALEEELGVSLLHRSTRKLSMTEAGEGFYDFARDMVLAAEQGRICISQLRDDLAGTLRIATTPELGINHVLPALSTWMTTHKELDIHLLADNRYIDMIAERADIAVRMSPEIKDTGLTSYPLANVQQVIVASPQYLRLNDAINTIEDLKSHNFICIELNKKSSELEFKDKETGKKTKIEMTSRIHTNNILMATTLAKNSHGLLGVMALDVQKELESGELVEVLPQYELPEFVLYAVTQEREQQPAKVYRCLDMLRKHFQSM